MKDLVQARMINEVIYCERLMYLERVQGEFEHNYFTVDGLAVHRRADAPAGSLPPILPTPDDTDRPYKATSVWLSSEALGLTAKIDVVEGDVTGVVSPVEYKRGAAPDIPEGAYLPERAQLCAHTLLLREHGYRVDHAYLYFAKSRRRAEIAIDDDLIAITKTAADRVRELTSAGVLPPPLVDSPKCDGCSLIHICLPDEVHALAGGPQAIRRVRPVRDDRQSLHVQEQGARVGLSHECLLVRGRSSGNTEVPIAHTSQVCLHGNVQISSQAMRELFYREVPVAFFTSGGWYCGRTVGSDPKNVALRLAQLRASSTSARSLSVARRLVAAKITNCRTLLRRHADTPDSELADLDAWSADTAEASAESLLGIEGQAARLYFSRFASMLKPSVPFSFEHRNRRPPKDPVNALLSFAYALLCKDFTVTLAMVGLEPLIGVYHRPVHGRPALALDLMEEFRPIIADSVVLTVLNTRVIQLTDFREVAGAVSLLPTARRAFIQAYERRLDEEITHFLFGYAVSYRRILEIQCRLFGRWLEGEIADYPSFLVR